MTVAGLEAGKPWGDFVARFEAAAVLGRKYANPDPGGAPVRQDSVKWLAGLDWTPGGDWTISGQLSGDRLLGGRMAALPRESYLATLSVSRKLFNQLVTVTNMLYADLPGDGFYDSMKVEYEAADGLIVTLGADLFWGKTGRFALFRDNSQAYLKIKLYF
jgi:hypothetical protein